MNTSKKWLVSASVLVVLLSVVAIGCSRIDAATPGSSSIQVEGTVISGGDTTPLDGPIDTPRKYVYLIQEDDGRQINVSYTAYPPSPVGDAAHAKITLEFHDGSIDSGDYMQACGIYNAENNTVTVLNQGDYLKTYSQKP